MKKNTYFLNLLLAVLTAALCLWGMLVKTFAPSVVLPRESIPMMVLLMSIALAAEYYFGGGNKREWIGSTVLSGITFSLLPWCAGLTGDAPLWLLFLCGAAVFTLTTLLYTSMVKRMKSGRCGKAAPAVNALLLFLAAQFFQGIL